MMNVTKVIDQGDSRTFVIELTDTKYNTADLMKLMLQKDFALRQEVAAQYGEMLIEALGKGLDKFY